LGLTRQAKEIIMKNKKIKNLEEAPLKEYKIPILDAHVSHPYFGNRQNLPQVG
jgi:hypothetical protein